MEYGAGTVRLHLPPFNLTIPAKIVKSLLSSLLEQATGLTTDKNAATVLSSLVITPTETEVLVQADVSAQAVADFIREETKPKKPEATPDS